jgi:hypothetical protein
MPRIIAVQLLRPGADRVRQVPPQRAFADPQITRDVGGPRPRAAQRVDRGEYAPVG